MIIYYMLIGICLGIILIVIPYMKHLERKAEKLEMEIDANYYDNKEDKD